MWRTNNGAARPSSHRLVLLGIVVYTLGLAGGQYFDPKVTDKVYLDNLQQQIEVEVNVTREELYTQAKVIENVTKQFVAAQLKENLFIALRVLAEKELQQLKEEKILYDLRLKDVKEGSVRPPNVTASERRPKQDDGDDDDGESAVAGATTLRPADGLPFQMGLIPQVANLVKAIFGGNKNVNLTSYVSSATRLLPKPVGSQVVGLVSLLSTPSAEAPTSRPTQFRRTNRPAAYLPVIPQENQVGLQQIRIKAPYQAAISSNQPTGPSELDNFGDLFTAVGQIKSGPTAQPQKRTTHRTYVYNTFGSKGVAGVSATARPVSASLQLEEYIPLNPQPTVPPQNQFELQLQQQPQDQFLVQPRPSQGQFLVQPQPSQGQFQEPQQVQRQPIRQKPAQVQFQPQQVLGQLQPQQVQPQQVQGQFQPQQVQAPQGTGPFQGQQQISQPQSPAFPPFRETTSNPDEDEDEDDDEDGRKRQFSLGSLLPSLLGNTFRSTVAPAVVQSPPVVQAAAAAAPTTGATGTQTAQGTPTQQGIQTAQTTVTQEGTAAVNPAVAMMAEGFNLRTFAMDVGKNLSNIFRVMPDIFRGAREGVQLLQTLSSVFGGLDGLAGIADLGGIL